LVDQSFLTSCTKPGALVFDPQSPLRHAEDVHNHVALPDSCASPTTTSVRRGSGEAEQIQLEVLPREALPCFLHYRGAHAAVELLHQAARADVLAIALLAPVGERSGRAHHGELFFVFGPVQLSQLGVHSEELQTREQTRERGHGSRERVDPDPPSVEAMRVQELRHLLPPVWGQRHPDGDPRVLAVDRDIQRPHDPTPQ